MTVKLYSGIAMPKVGPYEAVTAQFTRKVRVDGKLHTFLIVTYGAYNAMGLIGTERNGVAILNATAMCVVLDDEAKQSGGWYYGFSVASDTKARTRAKELYVMPMREFREFIVSHPRYRGRMS